MQNKSHLNALISANASSVMTAFSFQFGHLFLHASRSGLSHWAISDVLLREHTAHATGTPLYWESKARTVYNWYYTNQYNNQLLNFRVLIILNETSNLIETLKKTNETHPIFVGAKRRIQSQHAVVRTLDHHIKHPFCLDAKYEWYILPFWSLVEKK